MKRLIDLRSLPAQMILSFVALVLLTAAAAGLPAIWLIRGQLEGQAWARVEQGVRAAQALYTAQQNEVTNLATLTAQRPSLRALLAQDDPARLLAYLRTLQAGAGLDLVLVCDAGHQPLALAGEVLAGALCTAGPSTGFQIISAGATPQVWLFAAHPIDSPATTGRPGMVVVGKALNDEFAGQMRAQTGLDHTLLVDGRPVATSLKDAPIFRQRAASAPLDEARPITFELNDRPYYALDLPLAVSPEPDGPALSLEAEVALAVADIAATQQGLIWTLASSIVLVAAVGSVLGTFLARRISRPLARLTKAASALSQGDLDSSIAIEARVREVALVAQALESARIDLRQTLTELQREKAWTDHLLEAIVEGIMTLDRYGRITFFSPGAERITGWPGHEVLGRSCDEVFRPAETEEPFSQLIPPPGRRHKVTVTISREQQATLAITGASLTPPGADAARVALVFRDVSEEEAVHRLIGHFLANVSHEFRTPLSALAASAELLLDQAPDLSAAELHELLTSLHLGILSLQKLVDNLLESASIEAGRFRVNVRPTDLGKIIAEAIRVMQPLVDKHGQRFVLELPAAVPVVRADWRRTVQVLVNLLSNASKYGPDEAEITLGAAASGQWVRLTVADRGPGISPEYRNDLFRRFIYPDSNNDKSRYGAGLGLSVVKAVVEAQGGRVGVEDRPGGGSIFWFTLPLESDE